MDGFLNAKAIKTILEKVHLYPLGRPMAEVSAREIEETLRKNPFIEMAECHKTQSGHVCIRLKQRMPVVHVMADNNENYYVDTNGGIMPETRVATDNIIATGHISKKYAQKYLAPMVNIIIQDKFWQSQIEQINVLNDGSMEIVPRVGEHIVCLGAPSNIEKKLERLRKFYQYGLNQAGWNKYAYINIEFDNQIICKKK
jgi:cell division protein FtsQ